jgi:HSP20 family protein
MMTTDPGTSISQVITCAVSEQIRMESMQIDSEPSFRPPFDIKSTAQEMVVYIDLPGVDEDELKFNWNPEMLTIGGHRDFDHDSEDAEEFVQIQRTYGHFACRIPLDRTVDIDHASAKYRRGVLKVRIPRRRVYG